MLWLKIAALLFAGFSNILMGLLVLARSTRRLNNYSFFALSVSMAGWALGIAFFYLSDTPTQALFWAKVYYLFPLLVALSLVAFVGSFPEKNKISKRWLVPALAGFFVVAVPLLAAPSYLTSQIAFQSWGKEVILNKQHYAIYTVYITFIYVISLLSMYLYSKNKKGVYASQAQIFFAGFLTAFIFGVTFNLILPWFGNYRLIWVGPLFISAFQLAIAYAIMKHRMFDIRLVVARALGYASSIGFIAIIYGVVLFLATKWLFNLDLPIGTQIFLALATGFSALAFQSFKARFDKVTNKIFFRDAYDPQELFDRLNKVLVSSLDIKYLMMQSISIIETALKPDFMAVGLRDGELRQRMFASRKFDFEQGDSTKIRKLTPHVHHKVIVTDYLEESEHAELKELLQKNNIAVLVRLSQNVRVNDEGLGYLLLGAKKSGNPYNQQDLRVLDTVANELIIAIQNALHYEEIQKFNLVLQAKVDDATRKIRNTNEKLRALDETKDDFISMASHQLRTPLTSVKGYLSMVLEGDAGHINATQKKMLGQAYISSQRMVFLIADLLNVSRLKTGKFEIQSAPTNLAQMVGEEIDQLVETASAREIELSYDQPSEFPDLMLDETKTRQVIMNFVDNAIYYTQAGGHIKVELSDTPTSIELKVIDDGIGVPKTEQPHLFTKFYRAGNARKARPDGTGLGLYMAKKVVLAQGGSILFESREGKGSTFGFLFPKNLTKHVAKLPVVDNATETISK